MFEGFELESEDRIHSDTTVDIFWRRGSRGTTTVEKRGWLSATRISTAEDLTIVSRMKLFYGATVNEAWISVLLGRGSSRKLGKTGWRKAWIISRGHATLHLAVSVGRSVRHISEFRAVFALLLLPNRRRLDSRVSSLVFI